MKKNSCTPINPKKIFILWPKKNSYKEFDNEKKFLRLENSPPPHNFSNGPSLSLRELPIKLVYLHRYKVVLLLVTWCQNARSAHRNVCRPTNWKNNTVKAPWRIGFWLDRSLAHVEQMERRNPTLHGPSDWRTGRESKGKDVPLHYWEQGSRNIRNPALWEGQINEHCKMLWTLLRNIAIRKRMEP